MMDHEITIGKTLFDRVVLILEQTRSNVVQSVNTNMVTAYWLIGREIVVEIQCGKERAAYGKQVIETLSQQLSKRYDAGFSITNLQYFRKFYQTWPDRLSIQHLAGAELDEKPIPHPPGRELGEQPKSHPPGSQFATNFSPQLSWSHYRALMRVSKPAAREFYEREAIECGWSKTQLERQIQTSYYERILAHHGEQGLLAPDRERLAGEKLRPVDVLKSPLVLEFLDLPDDPNLHESKQIFASKYLKFLPTEEELKLEIEKERRLIEANLADRKQLA